ncbi:acid protease [Lichtheimia hyalospora FSU 10163]|nr:acid protease [Lichtheimia hyalospora FSU 10163]
MRLLFICLLPAACLATNTIRLPIRRSSPSTPLDHRHLKRSAPPRNGAAQLYNDEGSEYLVRVSIGTPPQNFTVALDTGSSDLWIPSTECPLQLCPLARYDPTQSSTYEDTGEPFRITYGIGNANGSYARDTVHLGQLQVEKQQFGLAKLTDNIVAPGQDMEAIAANDMDNDHMSNGIFGLGYPGLTAAKKYDPFVFSLAKQGLLNEPVFSIHMGSLFDKGWAGDLLLGGIDSTKYRGNLVYAPVRPGSSGEPLTYWMCHGQGIRLLDGTSSNGTVLDFSFTQTTRGFIIDTGTTLTYMDKDMAEPLVEAVAGTNVVLDDASGTFIVPCRLAKRKSQNLHLELVLSNSETPVDDPPVRLHVPVTDLFIPLDGDSLDTATQCMFGIAPWVKNEEDNDTATKLGNRGLVLVGDTVLRATYLVFDMGQDRIGFAQAIGSSSRVSGTSFTNTSTSSIVNSDDNAAHTAITQPSWKRDAFIATLITMLVMLTQ